MVDLMNAKRIKVENYLGFWSAIDCYEDYILLEHNNFGDETCYLVVNKNEVTEEYITLNNGYEGGIPVFKKGCNVYETFDDIVTCLEDEGII